MHYLNIYMKIACQKIVLRNNNCDQNHKQKRFSQMVCSAYGNIVLRNDVKFNCSALSFLDIDLTFS